MSAYRAQALIDVPVERVWELLVDVNRHPEWWPRVVDVACEGVEQGCTYRQVTKTPFGKIETDVYLERLDDCREVLIRCLDTGTFTRWLLTDARGAAFVDAEFGMDPTTAGRRVIDAVSGKWYFRRWLEQSVEGLKTAARQRAGAPHS